jgi:hypothetical protein
VEGVDEARATVGEMRNVYKVVVGIPQRNRPLREVVQDGKIIMDLEEAGCEGANWIHVT